MTTTHHDSIETDMHYLQLLAQSFPTIADASTEIINLEAIMALPKGTEHFLADLHGESGAFQHVLKNASGNIKRTSCSKVTSANLNVANYARSSITPSRSLNLSKHERLI